MGLHRNHSDQTLTYAGTTVGANQTNGVAVSKEFQDLGAGMSVLVAASVTNVTNASTSAKLRVQQASKPAADGTFTWSTLADSAALTTANPEAVVEIRASAWDGTNAAKFPCGPRLRLVCVTGAGDSVTVGQVYFYPSPH